MVCVSARQQTSADGNNREPALGSHHASGHAPAQASSPIPASVWQGDDLRRPLDCVAALPGGRTRPALKFARSRRHQYDRATFPDGACHGSVRFAAASAARCRISSRKDMGNSRDTKMVCREPERNGGKSSIPGNLFLSGQLQPMLLILGRDAEKPIWTIQVCTLHG